MGTRTVNRFANGVNRFFKVEAGGELTTENLELTRGSLTSDYSDQFGAGAILIAPGGAATARSCQFVENSGSLPGDAGNAGAVLVGDMYDPLAAASFVAEDCVFRGNYGGEGGAVFVGQYSTFDCVGCVFEANIAAAGSGGVHAGGAIYVGDRAERVNVTDTTFLSNVAEFSGGAVFIYGEDATFTATNCTFSGNLGGVGGEGGGAIGGYGHVAVHDCTFDWIFAPNPYGLNDVQASDFDTYVCTGDCDIPCEGCSDF